MSVAKQIPYNFGRRKMRLEPVNVLFEQTNVELGLRLIRDVAEILSMFGLRPSVDKNRDWSSVQMRGYNNFFRFSELVGWNSKKYVDKINAWMSRYPELVRGASGEVVSHGPVVLKSAESPEAEFDSRLAPLGF